MIEGVVPELAFGLVAVAVFVFFGFMVTMDFVRAAREFARLERRIRALRHRKQDWTPREHPDVWR